MGARRARGVLGGATVIAAAIAMGPFLPPPAAAPAPGPAHVHASRAAAPPVVRLVVRDGRMTASARRVRAGRVTLAVSNRGARLHSVRVVRTAKPISAFLRRGRLSLPRGRARIARVRPGRPRRLTVTLAPGRYLVLCEVPDHQGSRRREYVRILVVARRRAPAPVAPAPSAGPGNAAGPTTLRLSTSGLFAFSRTSLTAPAGTVTLTLENTTPLDHNLAVKGNGIDVKGPVVGQGKSSSVTVELGPGTYAFYCSVAGHEAGGMKGTLRITPADQPAPPEPPVDIPPPAASSPPGGGTAPGDPPGAGGSAPAPPSDPRTIELSLLSGPRFDRTALHAPAGLITVLVDVPAAGRHRLAIRGQGVEVRGAELRGAGRLGVTAELAPGIYVVFCQESGHEESGEVALLTVTDGAAPPPGGTPPSGGSSTLDLAVSAAAPLSFSTAQLTASAGPVTLRLTNNSDLEHNVAIRGGGVNVEGARVARGGVSTATAELAAGTYTYFCTVGGHEAAGMSGTLTVTP